MASRDGAIVPAERGRKRPRLDSMVQKNTKSGLATAPAQLDEQELDEDRRRSEHFYRKNIAAEISSHANAETPYGKVPQEFAIGIDDRVECVDPCAWLYYMCLTSVAFRKLMQGIVRLGRPLRIVIYNGALIPGSPFRPDRGRVVETFYWCIADWPDHVLQRPFCWPEFAVIRKSLLAKVLGGLSAVAGFVLNRFTRLFTVGVRLPFQQSIIVCGVFAGWLADLVGHKELTCWKGHNGTRACLCCKNLKQHGRAP